MKRGAGGLALGCTGARHRAGRGPRRNLDCARTIKSFNARFVHFSYRRLLVQSIALRARAKSRIDSEVLQNLIHVNLYY